MLRKDFLNMPWRDFKVLLVFYFIAHGGIFLLLNSIYWDDWTLWNVKPDVIIDAFYQMRVMFDSYGYMHVFMLMVGPWFYKLMTFLLIFASGILLYSIIKLRCPP